MTNRLILAMTAAALVMVPALGAAQSSGGGGMKPPTAQPPTIQTKRAVVPTTVDPRHWPQAFSVVLVIGEMAGTQQSDDVPAAARKALTDLKDFLPYKSYRLLDTQWTLCCGRDPLFSRLRGLDGQDYELHLTASVQQASNASAPTVNVQQFWLAEARSNPIEAEAVRKQINELRRQQELVERQLAPNRPPTEEIKALEAQLKSMQAELASGTRRSANRTVINTSFRMDVGETVVVGTSRIQGDKALIALLTAVPPKGATAR